MKARTVLQARGLVKRFGRREVLRGVDLDVTAGKVTVLLGRNGVGKTTLFHLALGTLRPTSGTVSVLGMDLRRSGGAVRRAVGFVPATPDVPPWMTITDLFRFLRPRYPRWSLPEGLRLVEELGVPRDVPFGKLSRGEGMKGLLAAAVATSAGFLILDEPFGGLDPMARDEVLEGVIRSVAETERTVLLATHDLEVAARVAETIVVLDDGRVSYAGPLEQESDQAGGVHQALRGLLRTALAREGGGR